MKINQDKTSGNDKKIFVMIVAVAVIVTLIFVFWPKSTASHQLSARATFAECLSSKGVIMYGSDTCENCQLQKGMFEDDFSYIHYVNCDIHQNECNQKDIQHYPTWMYNSQSLEGIQTFPKLAQLSACLAP